MKKRQIRIKKTTYHDNGKVHEEYTTNECNKKFGEYKEWDIHGKLIAWHYYEDSVMLKHCIDFYENGNKEYETIYFSEDISVRTFIHYDKNGKIMISTDFRGDDIHGWNKTFYENGEKEEETYYQDFYKSGICKKWYPNGILQSEEEYGPYEKLNGYSREWDYQGKLIKEEFYVDGVLQKK